MITYISGAPKIHAPNATITHQVVISETVRAGDLFEYAHTSSLRASIDLTVVAPDTTSLRLQVLSNLSTATMHTRLVQSWNETTVNLKIVKGQILKLESSSDMYVRLVILGESS
jgi:hypothetical protein